MRLTTSPFEKGKIKSEHPEHIHSLCHTKRVRLSSSVLCDCTDVTANNQENCSVDGRRKTIYSERAVRVVSRMRLQSLQTIVGIQFLKLFGYRFGLSCPTSRGSRTNDPFRILDNDIDKTRFYGEYVMAWPRLVDHVKHSGVSALTRNAFPETSQL